MHQCPATLATLGLRVAALVATLPTVALAELPVIQLTGLSQHAGQIGGEFDLRITSGNHLVEVDRLLFSDARITAEPLTDDPLPWTEARQPRSGEFRVRVADDTPPGRYEVRAAGRHGLSNPRAFLVCPLPVTVPGERSHNAAAPVEAPADTLLVGQATAAANDYYLIHLAKGVRYRIEVVAQRLDSPLIGRLTLSTADGTPVASARGSEDVDPRLTVDVPEDGDYSLAVQDFLYRGGEGFHYLLCLQDEANAIHLLGEGGANQIPRWDDPSALVIAAPGDQGAMVATLPTKSVTLGTRVLAAFDSRHHEDVYRLTVDEDQPVSVAVYSHRLGEPADPRLTIQREEGSGEAGATWTTVVETDDCPPSGDVVMELASRDAEAVFPAVAGANYRLGVRDLDNGAALGVSQDYWLDVRRATPGFALLAYRPASVVDPAQSGPVGSNLRRGGIEAIRVVAVRRDGWTGPIEVAVEGLPEGVACKPAIMAASQNVVQLTLTAEVDAAPWLGPLTVVGRAAGVPDEAARPAVPATIVRAAGQGMEIDTRLTADLLLSVAGVDVSPLAIELGNTEVIEAKRGETVSVPIRLTRREGAKEACILRPRDLPPNVSAAEVSAPADATDFKIDVAVGADAVPGAYSFWLQAETGLTFAPNPQALERATAYRDKLVALRDDSAQAGEKEQVEAALAAAEKLVEAAKPQAAAARVVVHLPTTHATLRIIE